MDDIEIRRRRALYRAQHRGTKEMDWLLGRYAETQLVNMQDADLTEFEHLLSLPDPELQAWIMDGKSYARTELAHLIERIRGHHGLGAAERA